MTRKILENILFCCTFVVIYALAVPVFRIVFGTD